MTRALNPGRDADARLSASWLGGQPRVPAKPSSRVDEAVVRAWVERTRAEQGVPVKVTDPRIIERVAAVLRLSREEAGRRAIQAQNQVDRGHTTSE
jgi:hypothetical protein